VGLKDRGGERKVVTHRIACGRPGRPPRSLDYLEITTTEQPAQDAAFPIDDAAMQALVDLGPRYALPADKTGGAIKPRRIPVRVDSDTIDEFLMQAYRCRVAAPVIGRDGEPLMKGPGQPLMRPQVWCAGDGVEAHRGIKDKKPIACCASPKHAPRAQDELLQLLRKSSLHNPADGKRCPFAQNNDAKAGPTCKPETVLICRSDVVANVGAFCRIRSHGHFTADALRNSFEQIKGKMPNGLLTDVPLDLVLTMKRFAVPGSTATTAKPVLHVELRLPVEETVRLLNANLQQHLQVAQASRRLLAAAVIEADTDEAAEEYLTVDGADGAGGLGR
jgi:hypothetical protein